MIARLERPATYDYRSFRDIPPQRKSRRWLTVSDATWGKHDEDAPGMHADWRSTSWTVRFLGRYVAYYRNRAPLGHRSITIKLSRRLHGPRVEITWIAERPIVLRRPYNRPED